jgi:hypothetical protein
MGENERKRAPVAQCTGGEFQGRLCESVEVCPALCRVGSATLDLGQDFVNHGVLGHRLAQSRIQPLE